jgi:hypothetical protein
MEEISDRNILDDFTIEFSKIVEKFTEYIVVSGYVAISSGRTRGTEDIDMIIPNLNYEEFNKLNIELIKNDFSCIQSNDSKEIYNYLTDNLSVRYIKNNEPLPEMELKFSKDELDEYQLKTKTKLELTGLDLWFSNINVNIAFKEELLKSPKDIDDANHLRVVYSELIENNEITEVKNMIKRLRL